MLLNNLQNEFEVIIQQCSETEPSNFFSIISQVLLNSVVIYVKEESIAHILLQLIYFNQQKLTVFEIYYWKDIITSIRKKLTRSQVALSYLIKEYTKQHCIDFILLDINSMLSYFLFSSKHYVNILRCPSIACWLNGRF